MYTMKWWYWAKWAKYQINFHQTQKKFSFSYSQGKSMLTLNQRLILLTGKINCVLSWKVREILRESFRRLEDRTAHTKMKQREREQMRVKREKFRIFLKFFVPKTGNKFVEAIGVSVNIYESSFFLPNLNLKSEYKKHREKMKKKI